MRQMRESMFQQVKKASYRLSHVLKISVMDCFFSLTGRAFVISSFVLYLTSNFAILTRRIGVFVGKSIASLPAIGFLNFRSMNDQTNHAVI